MCLFLLMPAARTGRQAENELCDCFSTIDLLWNGRSRDVIRVTTTCSTGVPRASSQAERAAMTVKKGTKCYTIYAFRSSTFL